MSSPKSVAEAPPIVIDSVVVPELRGEDDASVTGNDTGAAIALLDSVVGGSGSSGLPAGGADGLTAALRDGLLASVFGRAYGPEVEAPLTCGRCASLFDLAFSRPD